MSEKLFTVEYDASGEKVEIHLDRRGLAALRRALEAAERGGDAHLLSSEWGGEELTCQPQSVGTALLHHLKIFVWPDR